MGDPGDGTCRSLGAEPKHSGQSGQLGWPFPFGGPRAWLPRGPVLMPYSRHADTRPDADADADDVVADVVVDAGTRIRQTLDQLMRSHRSNALRDDYHTSTPDSCETLKNTGKHEKACKRVRLP